MVNLETTRAALEKNGITTSYVAHRNEVVAQLKTMIRPTDVVSHGGSVTLKECGVRDFLTSGYCKYLDRSVPGLTREQIMEVYRASFSADVYLTSSNAVTERGELYNVDGNSNRIAAIAFGPSRVIMMVGINKIVPDLDAAIRRVKTIAAPKNTQRLSCKTYCEATGECAGLDGDLCAGCASDARICCNYLVSAKQREPGRIHVIFVGEELGY